MAAYAVAQLLALMGWAGLAYLVLSLYVALNYRRVRLGGEASQVLLAFFAGLWPLSLYLPLATFAGGWHLEPPGPGALYLAPSAFVEEAFFRACTPGPCALWVLAFYAFHTPLALLPTALLYQLPLIPLGAMLCRAYEKGGLAAAFSMHVAHNMLASTAQIDANPVSVSLLVLCYTASTILYFIVTS